MQHTLGTAAKATGKSRSTILRAVKDGKISATKDHNGNYAIDPAELHRVFNPVAEEQPTEQIMTLHATPKEASLEQLETAVLRAKLEGVEVLLKREQQDNEDLRKRLDQAETDRREADKERRELKLITDQREQEAKNPKPKEQKTLKQILYFLILLLGVLIAYEFGKGLL